MISMSNEYIIKFCKDILDLPFTSEKIDSFLQIEVSDYLKIPILTVRTKKGKDDENNNTLLHKYITSDFAEVEFDDSSLNVTLSYLDGYPEKNKVKSLIEFDSNSASAYSTFKDSFQGLLDTKTETQLFESYRTRYIGEVINMEDCENEYEGYGKLFYDNPKNTLKYEGQFENGEFDGSGKFYDSDSDVNVIANNISDGVPNQKGKLNLILKNQESVIDFKFSKLWEKLGLTTKIEKKEFVSSDSFVKEVLKVFWNDNNKDVDEILFENKPIEEQNSLIRKEIIETKKQISDLHKILDTSIRMDKMFNGFMFSLFFANSFFFYRMMFMLNKN